MNKVICCPCCGMYVSTEEVNERNFCFSCQVKYAFIEWQEQIDQRKEKEKEEDENSGK